MNLYLDTECYIDYFLLILTADDGRCVGFEMYDGHPLDKDKIYNMLHRPGACFISFNGNNYDMCMLSHALSPSATNVSLKAASDAIIMENLKPWEFEKRFDTIPLDSVNHIDMIEVAPGTMVSLKVYAGRLHAKKLQDLPLEPSSNIVPEMRAEMRKYCYNDTQLNRVLFNKLRGQITLRETMSAELGVDLRSKSDAQIAESVLKHDIAEMRGGVVPRKLPYGTKRFKYVAPRYIKFYTPALQQMLATLTDADMVVKPTGHVEMPPSIDELDIQINGRKYKIGIGGIHSQESEISLYAGEDHVLRDIDVVSYYPNLMLNMGMYPDALGTEFLEVYRNILTRRVAAKRRSQEIYAELDELKDKLTFMC